MVQIEYNKTKISVPQSWDDITLGFYESFYAERPETSRQQVAMVAKICNTEAETLLAWPTEIFDRIVEYIAFIFRDNPAQPCPYIETGGVKYMVSIEDELCLGEWVDIDEVQKTGENLFSNILAIVCRPAGEEYNARNNESRAALFAALPVSKVLGVLAFFLHCKTVLDNRTAAYSNLLLLTDQLPRNIKPLLNRGDGTRSLPIWPTLKYFVSMTLLRFRLRRFLRSFNTGKTKNTPKRHKGNSINS